MSSSRRFSLVLVPTAPSALLPSGDNYGDNAKDDNAKDDRAATSVLNDAVDFTLVFAEAVSSAAVVVQVPMVTLLDAEHSCSAISIDLDLEALLGIEPKAFLAADGRDVVLTASVPVHKQFPVESVIIVWPPPTSSSELGMPVSDPAVALPSVADVVAAPKVDFAFGLSALSFAERVRRAHSRLAERSVAGAVTPDDDPDSTKDTIEMSVADAGAMAHMIHAHDLFALECHFLAQPEVIVKRIASRDEVPAFVAVARPPAAHVASSPVGHVDPVLLRPVRFPVAALTLANRRISGSQAVECHGRTGRQDWKMVGGPVPGQAGGAQNDEA